MFYNTEDIQKISTDFCEMVASGRNTLRRSILTDDQLSILLKLVSLGGFKPIRLEQGEMKRKYIDADDYYTVNSNLGYKVILEEGESEHATGWLETIFSQALGTLDWNGTIPKRILEGIPLNPIRLTKENEFMREYPAKGYFDGHTKDEDKIGSTVGVHTYCNGFVDMKRTSLTHNVLYCRSCSLRVVFPIEIKTYGELREHIGSQLNQPTV